MAALALVTDDVMIVGGGTAGLASQVAARAGLEVRAVPDRVPDSGPLGGLEAALAAARDEALVVLACDMPFVTPVLLAYLLGLAGEADAVVPLSERGYHPLCAVYRRACQPAVTRLLAARRLKMAGLFDEVRVRAVATRELDRFGDHRRLLANINAPADYEALRRYEP
jgi:molybdopterin-guanine dinucleotide biosynthesis protein A